jgi:nitrite reductase/ring-hydroxylating ferredoxin subunit
MSEPYSAQQRPCQGPSDKSDTPSLHIGRRRIVQWGWLAAGAAFVGGQLWILLKLFFSAHDSRSLDGDIMVGAAEQFAPGSVTHLWKEHFLLVHHATGFLALSHDCTHNRCRVDFQPARGVIVCPCHGSQFSVTGAVLTGPASRPLKRYTVSLHDGQVVVHTTQPQSVEPSS